MPVLHKAYLFISLVLIVLVGGCSSFKTQEPVYSAKVISRADLLSGQILFGEEARHLSLPEDRVLDLNERMIAYVDRYVPKNHAEVPQVRNLLRMMVSAGAMGMEYDMSKTYTAREAFRKLEGNCLAFSYLFAAFARNRGLKVSFQEVEIPPEWDQISDELLYLSRHVNVRVHMRQSRDYVVDIDRINYKPHYRAWKLSTNYAVALYYSNRGADYLNDGDYKNAFRYLAKALKLSPRDAAIWSNLGVLYRMQGIHNYAEKAYFIALKYDRAHRSVLNNLSVLYDEMGEPEKADYYAQLAREHQMRNPYYRYYQALEAFEQGDYALSLNHLKAAVKYRDDVKKFHDLLGQTYAKLGDEYRANQAWEKARRISYRN